MPDAQTHIDGRIASDASYNSVNGKKVANLRVLAGRSRKLDDGNYETLSTTAYDVAFWGDHAALVNALNPQRGDSVRIDGTITGVESYNGQNGESLSIKVNGDGLRVFPKQQQSGGNFGSQQSGGFQSAQQPQQGGGWGQNPQQDAYGAQGQQVDPWAAASRGQHGGGNAEPNF